MLPLRNVIIGQAALQTEADIALITVATQQLYQQPTRSRRSPTGHGTPAVCPEPPFENVRAPTGSTDVTGPRLTNEHTL